MTKLVRDVMSKEIFAVAPDTSLETAARMLASKEITGAPVVSDEGQTVGVITLVDLVDPDNQASEDVGYSTFYQITDGWAVTKGTAKGPGTGRVSDVMTPAALTAEESMTVEEAGRLMLEYKVHRLLVERDGELTGIISTMDVLRGLVGEG
jgi:predicted transcriptional regulator